MSSKPEGDFTQRNPDMFIKSAEENGVEYAAMFGADVNQTEALWFKLRDMFRADDTDRSFVQTLISLDVDTLQRIVLFSFYKDMEQNE